MNRPAQLTLATPVWLVPGVGTARAKRLAKLGVRTAQDLLFLFPRDYEYPPPPAAVTELKPGVPATIVGKITDCELSSRSPGKSVFGAIVENETGAVRILFFNQPFRAETLTYGRRVMISGTPTLSTLRFEFSHPRVKILEPGETPTPGRITPVYPLTDGIKQHELRGWIGETTRALADQLIEVLPEHLRCDAVAMMRREGMDVGGIGPDDSLPGIGDAIRRLHGPIDDLTLAAARLRFVFQELLAMQLALAMRRRQLTSALNAPVLETSPLIDARIINRFGFELTDDQRTVIAQIARDMGRQFPMNRLLQGDVGSGKTAVAMYAMMLAVAGGHQAVLMAPTEVLARQHHATLESFLQDSRVRIGLLCGSLPAAQRRQTLSEVADGTIQLLVGTQALLHGVEFHKLGLCVIDEQHKFGVGQRTTLRSGGLDPHYLVMSATPIPRSMAMTVFGDVDLSTIRTKPAGRGKVHTYLAHDGWRDRWWDFVRQRLDEGRQAFIVAPRVAKSAAAADQPAIGTEESSRHGGPEDAPELMSDDDASDAEDVSSVEAVYQELTAGPLSRYRVGLLHGRMSPDDKQGVMQQFARGELQALVSTTVIEVGINVPNATVLTILGANRFGLAQLHQLRGRVSRGSHPGHVCVFTDGDVPAVENERMKIFESTNDGFELAEADFRLRGPGDLLGKRQSGLPPLRIADLSEDLLPLQIARQMAQDLVDADPLLETPSLEPLRRQVLRRYGKSLEIGDVG